MKKFLPLIFIAVMAALTGVKFAIASEAPEAPVAVEALQQ
jgi:hypothetical protein